MQMPQVVLFGSIMGGWRNQHIIPVLEELSVSYYDPTAPHGWTTEDGDIEAQVMAACETIVMVVNTVTPAFTSLAETGWGALGAIVRNQHFILQVDVEMDVHLPDSMRCSDDYDTINDSFRHWITSSRYLVKQHALAFQHERLHVVDTVEEVALTLRRIYKK